MTNTIKTNDFIQGALNTVNKEVGHQLGAEVVFIKSPILTGLDDAVRFQVEHLCKIKSANSTKKDRLAVLLETEGGYIEVVERICSVFRKHFKDVCFIVPNYAYSAGTVLVLSGDSIYMDYYSVLGPIDPQIQRAGDGKLIPGMGYLYKYADLIKKSKKGTITNAELLFLTKRFDPAELYIIEQSRDHSKELIREWLVKYKFKDWTVTAGKKKKVTKTMKETRANQIAEILGDAARWHSHGRGISMRELTSDKIKLKIDDLEDHDQLNKHVRQYYDLLIDFNAKIGVKSAIHTELGGLTQLG